jgi:large subunit ribosomal protein L13
MSLSKSTDSIRTQDIEQLWYVADVKDAVLGRAAVKIANTLRGKTKPSYTPHTDTGDFVVVLNAASVKLTGNKLEQKMYRHHTQFAGGLKEATARHVLATNSEEAIVRAVKGMLPKGPLGRKILKKLKVYPGSEHPHQAQNPVELTI